MSDFVPSQALSPLRIAQVAPPIERVPPLAYGGTERIVDELSRELTKRGHEVVLFASADSESPGRLVPTITQPLRGEGAEVDPSAAYVRTIQAALAHEAEVDVIHAHLDFWNASLARAANRPVVATFHGRLDLPYVGALLNGVPAHLVALSKGHMQQPEGVSFDSFVYNGLSLESMPFGAHPSDDICFVGRMTADKGVVDAIDVAAISGRRLRIVAKAPYLASEREYYESEVKPALRRADVEELGELGQADRDQVLASSFALIMPSVWPEPFGLTAIESMACGTPVIARPVGALPEIVRQGRDGFLGRDAAEMAAGLEGIGQIDRATIRREVVERFSAARMADNYERIYRQVLAEAG
jgi:glycosyltransferase involved in cell wall biosynthesis